MYIHLSNLGLLEEARRGAAGGEGAPTGDEAVLAMMKEMAMTKNYNSNKK